MLDQKELFLISILRQIIKKFFTYNFLILFAISALNAYSNTGKVSGRITDAKTGAALPGVNVYLEDTTYGTATDEYGEYLSLIHI